MNLNFTILDYGRRLLVKPIHLVSIFFFFLICILYVLLLLPEKKMVQLPRLTYDSGGDNNYLVDILFRSIFEFFKIVTVRMKSLLKSRHLYILYN